MSTEFIHRKIALEIKEVSQYFPVITITGPRQSGKTTLIKHLFKDLAYYSLENLDVRNFALNDDPEIRYILSGSSEFSMLKNTTQSLAGRTAIFELLPFSYDEVRDIAEKKSLDELLLDGFYPAIYAEKNKAAYLYPNYVKTYLERDVRDLLAIKDLMQFQTFIRLCAGRIGSLFNASALANEVGVSSNTIKSWLSVLQASYLIIMLQPYFENSGKRLTKTPKLYFTDTGLACYLLGIETTEQLSRDKMRGFLFENFVVMEALKNRYNNGKGNNLFFYRDSHNNEVDLLLRSGSNFKAIEIKSSQTFHPDFTKGIKAFSREFGDRVIDKSIIYAGDRELVGDIKLLNYSKMDTILAAITTTV